MKFVHPYIVISVHSYDSIYTLRNAVVRSTSCGAPNYLTHTNTKARNMLLNKPTVGSV